MSTVCILLYVPHHCMKYVSQHDGVDWEEYPSGADASNVTSVYLRHIQFLPQD